MVYNRQYKSAQLTPTLAEIHYTPTSPPMTTADLIELHRVEHSGFLSQRNPMQNRRTL
jgi:hypothetical protein